jgi:hypothetical protein
VTTAGNSVSQQIAAAAPEGAHVVKAFNLIFAGVLAEEKPLDVFFAGDSAEAKARVAVFLESLDMRPSTQEASGWPTPLYGPASSWWAWHATAPASTSPWAPKSTEGPFQASAC